MPFTRRAALAAPALLLAHRAAAQAQQGFPARPVRIVVPYTPGGASDIAARLLSERLSSAWGQPVVVENRAGADGVIVTSWQAVMAPAGTPQPLLARIHEEVAKALRDPEATQRLEQIGFTVAASTPEEYAAFQRAEIDRWRRVIEAGGIKPE